MGPDEVLDRTVGNHRVESPIPLAGNCPVIEPVDVKSLAAAMTQLFRRNGDSDPGGATLPDSVQECPVPAANVQHALRFPTAGLVHQVLVLIRLGLFVRRLRMSVIDPFGQVEQTASRKEPVEHAVAGDNRPAGRSNRRGPPGQLSCVGYSHVTPAQRVRQPVSLQLSDIDKTIGPPHTARFVQR